MESIASRIIEVCNAKANGNMSAFAREIGVTPAYISKLKNAPDRIPSDRTINDICAKFGVNPVWLRTGEGDPYLPQSREGRITEVLNQAIQGPSTARDRLCRALARLPDEAFPLIEQYILAAAENILKEKE